MNEQTARHAVKILYNDFKSYFNDGKIILTGSFYYKYLDPSYTLEYNDIDIVIDEKPEYDYIIHEIYNHYINIDPNFSGFVESFDNTLIGCVGVYKYMDDESYNYVKVDILRNDFSQNLPLIEIIPGVFTNRWPDKKYLELFKNFSTKKDKYKKNLDFFKNRLNK